ncbi:MAG: ACT domain-containing protein, partial [Sphingomonadaceae bacterium]|nr:ACT domain-containing protein [Sphingomonadaceae bacterium]
PADAGERRGRAYLRFAVVDRAGVLAEITAAMRDAGVSIESMIQRGGGVETARDVTGANQSIAETVQIIIVTHAGPEARVAAALERLRGSPSLAGEPMWMDILDL